MIGANGSGKSSFLQVLAFVQYFAQGKSTSFFEDRGWTKADVKSRVSRRKSGLSCEFLLETRSKTKIAWKFKLGLLTGRLMREEIWLHNEATGEEPRRILQYNRGSEDSGTRFSLNAVRTEGTVLALFEPKQLSPGNEQYLEDVLAWGRGVTSLELLSPTAMRRGARGAPHDIGPRGERLAGFLAQLDPKQRSRLVERLSRFYKIENIETTRKRAGWVDLRIEEHFRGLGPTSAAHMSDGFLRILALCAIPEFDENVSLVLLDEVEDGIEPHILPKLIRAIAQESKAQLILTSHSPLLINFFEPDEVFMLARSSSGTTRATRVDELDTFKRGAEFFGSGEIWVNTNLNTITRQMLGGRPEQRMPLRFSPSTARAFMDGK